MQGLRVLVCAALVLDPLPVFAEGDAQERHRSIAKAYGGAKLVVAEAQRKHCNDLAASYDTQAKLYDAMAAAHEAEAKK